MMGYGDMASYGWVWMTLGFGFWIAVIALVVRTVTRMGRAESTSASAEEILKRRYASGEINENDFESARRTLRRG
jgi:uncharacterized membrane protein